MPIVPNEEDVRVRVKVEGLTVKFGDVAAVDELNISINDGELLALLGPSGCGKTSTMRALVGLEKPDSGKITVGDEVFFDSDRRVNLPPNKRKIGMVFQSYAIWPHRTVFQNVAFPLLVRRLPSEQVRHEAHETLRMVGLENLADRGASALSGGQMQRVALARSLVMKPKVLLLDEPLSNLDAKLRERLRFELRELQQELGITALYVTHDQTEAMAIADRIAIMSSGKIIQLGDPQTLYREPADSFVADFMGITNLFDAKVTSVSRDGAKLEIGGGKVKIGSDHWGDLQAGDTAIAAIRPEDVQPVAPGREGDRDIPARILVSSFLGSHFRFRAELAPGCQIEGLVAASAGDGPGRHGDAMFLRIRPSAVRLLDVAQNGAARAAVESVVHDG